jgi:two-component system, OmpR family, sensor kinase
VAIPRVGTKPAFLPPREDGMRRVAPPAGDPDSQPAENREEHGTPEEELAALRAEICALRNIRQDAERELAELRDAVAARDSFIATAGHELRNPMSAILLNVTYTVFRARQAQEAPEWLLERLASLDRQAKNFVRRATTLLDVSRLTAGRMPLDLALVSLDAVVREVAKDLAIEAERAGCRVELVLDPEARGYWDRTALEQIAGNLVSNAIKYGAGRPVEVSVQADPTTAALTVRDHGPGIAEADRERIFQRFERAVSSAERSGFGVGLWIARQLAVAHGGDIAVASVPGLGSVFTATLPRGIHESQS